MRLARRKLFGVVVALVALFAGGYLVLINFVAAGISGVPLWIVRTPIEYRIPENYQGYVRVRWGVKDAPGLVRQGKYLVVTIAPDGTAATSTPVARGWASDRYVYVSKQGRQFLPDTGWCKGGMIWGSHLTFGMEPRTESGMTVYAPNPADAEETFFVGSEEQYRKRADPNGNIFTPCS